MKRIRNLVLAALAALTVTAALGAAGASASQFVAESYPTTLSTPTPEGQHELTFHSAGTKCNVPLLEGSLASTSYTINTSAKDASCEFFGTKVLKMNGCAFTYHPGAETSPGVFKGTFDIGSAGCGPIQFGLPGSMCYITIPAQTGLAATFENVGAGTKRSVKIKAQATGLKHTQVSGSCEAGTFSDGTWTGNWTVQGTVGGKQAGIYVESTGPTFTIQGTPAKLVAEKYPMSILGDNGASAHTEQFQAGKLECKTAKFSSSINGPAAELAVQAEYGTCSLAGFVASVNMNGCSYTFNILSTTTGHADIACPAGKSIEVIALPTKPKCTVTIPAQTTDAGGLSFTNEPATSTIGVGLAITGIDFQQTAGEGVGKCTSGSYTNGTYSGGSTLSPVL